MSSLYARLAAVPWRTVLSALLILTPFFITLSFVLAYGVNMVFMDEWELVRLFRALDAGMLSMADLWEQHNEHRIFFVSMVTVALGSLTQWNLEYQMLASLALALGMLGVFCAYSRPVWKCSRLQYVLYLTLISALVFSMVQWENWLRGFQMQWFMCVASGILALYLLDARAKIWNYNVRFCLAIFLCFVSAYSLGSGIFFWLACLVPLIATRQSRRRILVWVGVSFLSIALYFYDYMFLEKAGNGAELLHYAQFFFGYLGNALTYYPNVAVAFGVIITALTVLALYYALKVKRVRLQSIALPVGMIVFVLLSALVTMQSRTNVTGAFGAVTGKYATISTLLIVALILILMEVHRAKRLMAPLLVAIVLVPLIAGVSLFGIAEARKLHTNLTDIKQCLMQDNPTEACLGRSHPSPAVAGKRLQFLKEQHIGGF